MTLRDSIRERKEGVTAFFMAAAVAPTAGLLLAAPCGLVCGGCPLGGACLAASPVVFGGVIIANAISSRRSKKMAGISGPTDELGEESD
jgi:hypothetical protein